MALIIFDVEERYRLTAPTVWRPIPLDPLASVVALSIVLALGHGPLKIVPLSPLSARPCGITASEPLKEPKCPNGENYEATDPPEHK
jgi:hypothetical protein